VAVLGTLRYHKRTGKGEYLDESQIETIIRTLSWVRPYQHLTGKAAGPAGSRADLFPRHFELHTIQPNKAPFKVCFFGSTMR
jgi:crotonobetainyl-CoA:carnitine CoA-transferase CaiB-like acyl-CoA transferase